MANTYDLDSTNPQVLAISKVRLHIPDREEPFSFSDGEILTFLGDYVGQFGAPKLAAADAVESKGSDEAFVQKVQTTLGESTNGAATATYASARAAALRDQVEKAAARASSQAGLKAFTLTTGKS